MPGPKEFSISVDIAAAPDRVWEVMKDVAHWHEWTSSVTNIRKMGRGPLGVGSRMLIRQPKLPASLWKITDVRDGQGFTSVTGTPFMRVTAQHTVRPSAGGTTVTLSVRFSGLLGSLVAQWTSSLNERYLGLEAAGLKKRCEGR